ncbi:MAG: PIN domain-containing protein [Cyclobacteriaceae bacterium]
MILVDTSVWISFLKKDNIDTQYILKSYLRKDDVFTVSAVFGELLQGVKSKRELKVVEAIWQSLPKVDESELFLKAGHLSNQHGLYAKGVGLIDCYLLAACQENELALWTLDKKLLNAFDLVNA